MHPLYLAALRHLSGTHPRTYIRYRRYITVPQTPPASFFDAIAHLTTEFVNAARTQRATPPAAERGGASTSTTQH